MGKMKGFNEFRIDGDIATIFIEKRDGTKVETIVDAEDIPRLRELNARWHVQWIDKLQNYYVLSSYWYGEPGNRRMTTLILQRVILGVNGDRRIHVDHINHNQLDNRKSNLRITTQSQNARNRRGPNRNNTSGYRNVAYIDGMWCVQMYINGKNTYFGKYTDVHEAGKVAKQIRDRIYGEYAGEG